MQFTIYATKILKGVHYEQNYVSSHMKTSIFTCIIYSHQEFHTSCFSLKLSNNRRRKIVISENIGRLIRIMTRAEQKILSNQIYQRIFRAKISALGTSKGLQDLHCSVLCKKKHWSPRNTQTIPRRAPDSHYRMELHKVEVSFFCSFSDNSSVFVTLT